MDIYSLPLSLLMGLRLGDGSQWDGAEPREHAPGQKKRNGAMKGGAGRTRRPE